MSLSEYGRKRDFKRTAEPKGERTPRSEGHRFVIQKHAASHLHYDFRLEMGGALKSWALPKGVPFAKGEKRLAVQVEDHPVAYLDFEGTIPKGEYGGGTVMVWDIGAYEPLSPSPEKALASGKLHFVLKGKKLKGEWYLVRFRDEKQWLLIKGGEGLPPVSRKLDDTSALSGKSMKQLAAGNGVWHSNQERQGTASKEEATAQKSNREPAQKDARNQRVPRKVAAAPASFVEPMKARLVEEAPRAGSWIYEIKFDGFRALALKRNGDVRLLSRNEKELSGKFPEVVTALEELDTRDAIIDGEIVALDAEGRSSFQLLQAYDLGEKRPPIFYYAFDLLRLDGADLRKEAIVARKARLEKLLKAASGIVRYSGSLGEDARALLPKVRKLGLEGLIGKRKDSVYEAGRRSGAWVKLKLHREQEMVIGGYTDPTGSRPHFGALLLGYDDDGKLRFAGKVGTGFNTKSLSMMYSRLSQIGSMNCPFVDVPEKKQGRYGQNLTPSELKRCHWVKPELVCQVKFSEWTRDGKLRQPVFLGLREDKAAREVVREQPHQA